MFLAWKEIKHSKGKFTLIMAVVALVSYLVYFLTSLAFGLASSYTNAVTNWRADHIVMTEAANENVLMSRMGDDLTVETDSYDYINVTGDKAKIGIFMGVVKDTTPKTPDLDTRVDVYVFGIDPESFLNPIPGLALADNEIIADSSIKELGYELGDEVVVAGTTNPEIVWTIVGFSEKTTYQTAPVFHMNLETWKDYRYAGSAIPETVSLFTAVVIRGDFVGELPTELLSYEINYFINTLPGYTAQVLTFSIMIIFLIIIVAFVLAIFIYVLTIQKTPMFGVMKAQGISNLYIANSVVSQTIILTTIGIAIGLALTILSGILLAGIVPFAINPLFYVVVTVAFLLFAVFGGLFSVKAVLKIDPLRAIS